MIRSTAPTSAVTAVSTVSTGLNAALTAVVLAVVLAGCTTVVPGVAAPQGAGAGLPPVPVIPDEPAEWAMSALDPCALLAGVPVAAEGPPFATKPHNCGVDYRTPDGRGTRLVVRVGIAFDTGSRSRSGPTTVGGLTAYQSRDTEQDPYDMPECEVDIPISAERSIQVTGPSLGGALEAACAGIRAAAESVAAKLANPAALTRSGPPTALGRWSTCDLLELALDYIADRHTITHPNADDCTARPPEVGVADVGPSVQIQAAAGPDTPGTPGMGNVMVDLPLGPALQQPLGSRCDVVFVAERLPGAPPEYAAHVVTVSQRDSTGDACADAVAAATKIQNTLSAPAPEPPAAPARLGIPAGEPDDVMPVACGIFGNTTPDTCRLPRPAQPPATADAVLAVTSESAEGPDVACAILRDAAAPVLGDAVELAASGTGGCIGLTADGYSVTLGFYPAATSSEYCAGLERQDVQVGGRTGIRCTPSTSTYDLVLPATPAGPDAPGVVLVDGRLDLPRGDRSLDRPSDEPRVTDLTTRITENVIARYLAR